MKLANSQGHLTYCTNIHPGEKWAEVFGQLKKNIPKLKARLAPGRSFGIGLRLSAEAAKTLQKPHHLNHFMEWLDEHNAYVFTINGFPYGNFHGVAVKDRVYEPDWSKKERLNYTLLLTNLLAKLVPGGMEGSISTSPISYKPWIKDPETRKKILNTACQNLAEVALRMAQSVDTQGPLHLDIEPEPDCLIENTRETINFFNQWLIPIGSHYLVKNANYSESEAKKLLLRHIRVCYDTCHFAVEYENARQSINALREAGIRIGKVQISAAIKAPLKSSSQRQILRQKLMPFKEDIYLHQVKERNQDGTITSYEDLPAALGSIEKEKASEWRIHYHVPVFVEKFGPLHSTQDAIVDCLELCKKDFACCNHFEIETYTWSILPDDLKRDVVDSIEREYRWVLKSLNE